MVELLDFCPLDRSISFIARGDNVMLKLIFYYGYVLGTSRFLFFVIVHDSSQIKTICIHYRVL